MHKNLMKYIVLQGFILIYLNFVADAVLFSSDIFFLFFEHGKNF